MDDLSNMLSQVLSDPDSMQQIQALATSLGLGDSAPAAQPDPTPTGNAPSAQGGPDLSALLAGLGGAQQQPTQPSGGGDLSSLLANLSGGNGQGGQSGGVDLSALSGLIGRIVNGMGQDQAQGQAPAPGAGSDNSVAALAALLGSGQQSSGQSTQPSMPFDMSTLLKLQQAMSSLSANQSNIQLLMALKPRLKPERAKKVDDAVRVMQLIQFLPLIKESGLFGNLAEGEGGLGGIVDGIGNGINNVLGGLFGGRR